jgi:hypothetical protein
MNTDKLLKAIQILIREELKTELPKIMKAAEKRAEKLVESKLTGKLSNTSPQKSMMDEDVIDDTVITQQFTKNPVLNRILNETAQTYVGAPTDDPAQPWPDMKASVVPTLDKSELAQKMGYGDMAPQGVSPNGLGVTTGLKGLDRVLNRDNRELIRAMDKINNYRPGSK